VRDFTSKGHEVSGYIDFAHRLVTEKFELYFDGKKKLMPKPSDLSYYNWETQTSTSNSSANFQVGAMAAWACIHSQVVASLPGLTAPAPSPCVWRARCVRGR
jgi:hypothetical protein